MEKIKPTQLNRAVNRMKELTTRDNYLKVYQIEFLGPKWWRFWKKPRMIDQTVSTKFFKLTWQGGLRFTLILPVDTLGEQGKSAEPKAKTKPKKAVDKKT